MPELPGTLKPPRLATAPGTPVAGQLYWDTALTALRFWNGTAWTAAGGASGSDPLKVDKDSVVAGATRIVANKLLAGDSQPAWRVLGNGQMEWGDGGASPPDTYFTRSASQVLTTAARIEGSSLRSQAGSANQIWLYTDGKLLFGTPADTNLYRSAASTLKTDVSLFVGQSMAGMQNVFVDYGGGGYKLYFGSAIDTNLYRLAADQLATDDLFLSKMSIYSQPPAANGGFVFNPGTVGGNALLSSVQGEANARFYINVNGVLNWGPGGAAAIDTSLYRTGAGLLANSGGFTIAGYYARTGTGGSVAFATAESGDTVNRWLMDTNGKMNWSPGNAIADTNLYRAAAYILKTDSYFQAAASINLDMSNGGYKLYWGSAGDTNLYRVSAGVLRTDGHLLVGGGVQMDKGDAGNALYWGSALDTNLYRSAANTLKTDSFLNVQGTFQVAYGRTYTRVGTSDQITIADKAGDGVTPCITFGSANDTNLYRSGAASLKTDGYFEAGNGITDATLPTRLRAVGPQAPPDLNNATNNGWYCTVPGAHTNAPVSDYGALQFTNITYTGAGRQVFYQHATAATWERTNNGGTWSSWIKVRNSDGSPITPGPMLFGTTTLDVNLYRSAANVLKTDDSFSAASLASAGDAVIQANVIVDNAGTGNALYLGSSYDAYLARVGTGVLGVSFGALGLKGLQYGAADSAGAGYRTVRIPN